MQSYRFPTFLTLYIMHTAFNNVLYYFCFYANIFVFIQKPYNKGATTH